MGYTHYWTQYADFSDEEWATATDQVKKILADFGEELAGWDGIGSPRINDTCISFNGRRANSCETFKITKRMKDIQRSWLDPLKTPTKVFNFCKTRRLPYDEAVVRVLAVFKNVGKDKLELASDGGMEVFAPYLEST